MLDAVDLDHVNLGRKTLNKSFNISKKCSNITMPFASISPNKVGKENAITQSQCQTPIIFLLKHTSNGSSRCLNTKATKLGKFSVECETTCNRD